MPEVVKYHVIDEDDLSRVWEKGSLCFLVDSAGIISRHTRNQKSVDSARSNLNIVRGNGDVEAYFRRQLLGFAPLYGRFDVYVHRRHEETFRDTVSKIGFESERIYN